MKYAVYGLRGCALADSLFCLRPALSASPLRCASRFQGCRHRIDFTGRAHVPGGLWALPVLIQALTCPCPYAFRLLGLALIFGAPGYAAIASRLRAILSSTRSCAAAQTQFGPVPVTPLQPTPRIRQSGEPTTVPTGARSHHSALADLLMLERRAGRGHGEEKPVVALHSRGRVHWLHKQNVFRPARWDAILGRPAECIR